MSQILNSHAVISALVAATIEPSRTSYIHRGRLVRPRGGRSASRGSFAGGPVGEGSRATPPEGVGAADGIGQGTVDGVVCRHRRGGTGATVRRARLASGRRASRAWRVGLPRNAALRRPCRSANR